MIDHANGCKVLDGECDCRPRHNHITRDIRPPGQCIACDEYHDRAMNVPVCYKRDEVAPGAHQDIPHMNTQCMETKA